MISKETYYQRNKEKIKNRMKEYRSIDVEKTRLKQRQYNKSFREKHQDDIILDKYKCYSCGEVKDEECFYISYLKNRDFVCKKCRSEAKKLLYSHSEALNKKRTTDKIYKKQNKARYHEYVVRRNTSKKHQTPPLTEKEIKKLRLYYQIREYLGEGWHVDHIVPISKGGLHHPDNLQVIRAEDNLSKNAKLDYEVDKIYCVRIENLKEETAPTKEK